MSDSIPTCPGAVALAGPPVSGPSVICGPISIDREGEAAVSKRENVQAVIFTSRKDPSAFAVCHGDYTSCAIWRAEKERIAEARAGLGGAATVGV